MKFTLINKKQETPDVTTFTFSSDTPFTWKAGQLLHYTLPHENPDDRGIERWFTISAAPSEKTPAITTRFAGEKSSSFKKALFSLPLNATIEADGLEGDFVVEDMEEEYVFIAGGIGITPFHSILKELNMESKEITVLLLYANRTDEIPFKTEFDSLAKRHPRLTIRYIIAPEHIDENIIKRYVRSIETPIFYISGPEPMVENLGTMLQEMGIAKEKIRHDMFPGYPESK